MDIENLGERMPFATPNPPVDSTRPSQSDQFRQEAHAAQMLGRVLELMHIKTAQFVDTMEMDNNMQLFLTERKGKEHNRALDIYNGGVGTCFWWEYSYIVMLSTGINI